MKDYDDPAKRTGRTTRMLWRAFEVAVTTGNDVFVILLTEDEVKRCHTMLTDMITASYAKQFPGFMCVTKPAYLHGQGIPANLRLMSQAYSVEKMARTHDSNLFVDHAVIFERYHGVIRRSEREADIFKQFHQFDAQLPEILPANYKHPMLYRWHLRPASPYPGSFVQMPMLKGHLNRGDGEEHY